MSRLKDFLKKTTRRFKRADRTKDLLDKTKQRSERADRADQTARVSGGDARLWRIALAANLHAIESFMKAINFGCDPKTQEDLEKKSREYMDRAAEVILKNLGIKETKTTDVVQTQNGKGKNAKKEDEAEMTEALTEAILTEKPDVRWSDVAGLHAAKNALKEAAILPHRFPQMFVGKRKPWKGILLYGPPGTGKSFLAKAVATEAKSHFFSVSSADLVSKWHGESEKLIKHLFKMARKSAPAVVFIDEIDSLVSTRDDDECSTTRRMKTEFLVQMDGVGNGTDGVLVLGATNIPWGLDDALLRRMERRVYIPLPDVAAREHMLKLLLGDTLHELTDDDFLSLARMSDGYSGSDLKTVCRDAMMEPVRLSMQATHFKSVCQDEKKLYTPCLPGDPLAQKMDVMEVKSDDLLLPPITAAHFQTALGNSKPSVGNDGILRYEKFTAEKGQVGD